MGVMVRRRMMVQAEHSAHRVRYAPSACQTFAPVRRAVGDEVAAPATTCWGIGSGLHEVMQGIHTNDAREDVSLSTPYDFYQLDRVIPRVFP